MGAWRDPPSKLLIPCATIISLKTLPASSPSRWAVNHSPAAGQQLSLRLPGRVCDCKQDRRFHANTNRVLQCFMVEEIPFKKNTTKNMAILYKLLSPGCKECESFHSFRWTASTFALEIQIVALSEPDLFPKRDNPSDLLQPIQILSDCC